MADDSPTEVTSAPPAKAAVPWVPLILVLLFIPIITLLLTELVVVPRLRSSLGEPASAGQTTTTATTTVAGNGAEAQPAPSGAAVNEVIFSDIVANLSGTMGTRFMKVSFHVTSRDPQLALVVQSKRPRVQDAIITTLSSRTIQELEATGGRNALRVALIASINQAIGMDIVEELFFTEFIIQ